MDRRIISMKTRKLKIIKYQCCC